MIRIDGVLEIDGDTGQIKFYSKEDGIIRLWVQGLPTPMPERGNPYLDINMSAALFNSKDAYLKPVRCNWDES